MTRTEVIKLLEFLKGCYPNVKIDDAPGMVDAWILAFGDKPAKEVYQGARLHMEKSKFFPTPADIIQNMRRAKLLYENPRNLLPAQNPEKTPASDSPAFTEEEFDEFWQWLISD